MIRYTNKNQIYNNKNIFNIPNYNLNNLTDMKTAKPKTSSIPSQKTSLNPRERLSENDVDELKTTFDLFDENQSGTIDPS